MEKITVEFELDENQALALAQFCKRVGFREFSINAVNEDEAYTMQYAQSALYRALREKGFDPR